MRWEPGPGEHERRAPGLPTEARDAENAISSRSTGPENSMFAVFAVVNIPHVTVIRVAIDQRTVPRVPGSSGEFASVIRRLYSISASDGSLNRGLMKLLSKLRQQRVSS